MRISSISCPDATFAIDKDGEVIAWNRAIEDMTGIPAAEMLGKGDHAYALPFYHARRPILIDLIFEPEETIAKNYSNITRQKNILSADTTLPRPKGRAAHPDGCGQDPCMIARGELIGAIESIRDITGRKKAEDRLVAANREYTNLLDQIQDIYYFSDTAGKLVRASRSMAALLGYDDISECIGRSIADDFYVNPSDRKPLLDRIRREGKVTGMKSC